MKVRGVLLRMMLMMAGVKANICDSIDGKKDFKIEYPKEDSCAAKYEFIYDSDEGCASNCVSCGLCKRCLGNCISCYPGYEIDVMFEDGTGKCVEKGTAELSLSKSDLYSKFESTVCPDIALGGCTGANKATAGGSKQSSP